MYYNFTSNIMGKGSFSKEMEMRKLHNKIENKKKELIQLVARHGLEHDKVLLFSKDLDILINKFMSVKDKVHK
ncbi:aspartyl-phosphate phosphatase Spo0E family protein [Bacillus sp. CH126_4D]|uniref:aspartyl-phosphate phosphatase Spo0E family protein n=1 Tax=unclassified Bacillus (in: firmicutes) TaxID=185979 RepID=UPI00124E11AB|nr:MULTISPECIES: aspartyl-phosphate phosphatase Spo0E family protein [unclassified Bacillus (in: firmicutes)]KAB2455016.1 aspartyl-phosphate phosphatase Spo0E family protein [Bacillus sp. CH140a_4T]KAB2473215.1 aspartyl-phosphate phosphatase Spo0E family protein [Bacillus sp. CH126_4D]